MQEPGTQTATSPGKAILFGEHAVVYGFPAVSLAVDLPTMVSVRRRPGTERTLDGSPEGFQRIPYLVEAARAVGAEGIDVSIRSSLPRASGLGSSAAVTCGLLALLSKTGPGDLGTLAKLAYSAEFAAQGVGSPADTSTLCAGGIVSIGGGGYGKSLWEIPPRENRGPWKVDRLPDPGWKWVVAYTGLPKQTGDVVSAVGRKVGAGASSTVEQIGALAERGIAALFKGDRAEVGKLMNENHGLLVELGVSNPRIEEIVEALRPQTLGVKITGAGRGGSLLALPRSGEEAAVARAFAKAGTVPFVVSISPVGVRVAPPSVTSAGAASPGRSAS